MTASDYYAFVWDMAGEDFRLHVTRLCGVSELLCAFKWLEMDEADQRRVSSAMSNMLRAHKEMTQTNVQTLKVVK